ncbi:MAG: GGDEF domain-containing protein [Lachnospiraceae bacterium]|nr:GGDEF domain-containing protein [Lachnospiraceae bacterium]
MNIKAWFKRYYERHKIFRNSYCDKQFWKIGIGNLIAGTWLLVVSLLKLRIYSSEFSNYNAFLTAIILSVIYLILGVLFFFFKLVFGKNIYARAITMEISGYLTCFATFIFCGEGVLTVFNQGGTYHLINPLIGWIIGWTLYTMYGYFPFYWYIVSFLFGHISFFLIVSKFPIKFYPEYLMILTIILLIGGIIRYNLGRMSFEVGEENRRLLESDRLTGVYNRRSYEERIVALREGKSTTATIVLFDVNGLKSANDTNGHLAGDELIMATADCISKVFEAHGKCFRIGGDEFVVVMEDNAEDINKLMKQFDETTAQWKGNYSDTLSVSYGIAQGKTEGDGISELIKTADANMYEAKRRYYVEHGIERRVTG